MAGALEFLFVVLYLEKCAGLKSSFQNFGIVCAFCVGFLICLLLLTEFKTSAATAKATTLFKLGTEPYILKDAEAAAATPNKTMDPEKQHTTGKNNNADPTTRSREVVGEEAPEAAPVEQPGMKNVFSWDHLNYEVKTADGSRKLLDDVSGFVAPGKLTALMGESGAGKVRSSSFPFHSLVLGSFAKS